MRIPITALIIFVNFILQTTLFPLLAIRGIFPNTALIIVTSYALLRGSKEGAIVGGFTGLLMDIFFSKMIGFYTLLYLVTGCSLAAARKTFTEKTTYCPSSSVPCPQFCFRQCFISRAFCSAGKAIFCISSSPSFCPSWSIWPS